MEDINKDIVQRVYLSRRIKEIRKQLGLSMSEFGEKLDTSKNSVSQWESAKVIPNAERLRKIAELGEVPVEFLYLSDLDVVDLNVELSSKYTELMMPASYFNDYTSCKVYKFDAELSFLIISGKHSLKASCYIYDSNIGYCSIVIEETPREIPHQFRYFIDYEFEDKKDEDTLIELINNQLPKELNLHIEKVEFTEETMAFEEKSLLPYSDTYSYGSNLVLKELQDKLLELRNNNPVNSVITGEVYEWLKHEVKTFELWKQEKSKLKEE